MKELITKPDYYKITKRSKILRIDRDHPYYRTSNKGNISEARLVLAEHLGRNLTKDDIVYHKDENCDNNETDNLVCLTRREFTTIRDWRRLKKLKDRIISKISIYEGYIADAGIDLVTLSRSDTTGRYREVDRDRESYERSRRYRSNIEE